MERLYQEEIVEDKEINAEFTERIGADSRNKEIPQLFPPNSSDKNLEVNQIDQIEQIDEDTQKKKE